MDGSEAECFNLAKMVRRLAEETSREEVLRLLNQAADLVLAAASWPPQLPTTGEL